MKAIMIEIDASIHPDSNWENNGYPVRDGSARFAVVYPVDTGSRFHPRMMILVSDDKKKWRPAIGVLIDHKEFMRYDFIDRYDKFMHMVRRGHHGIFRRHRLWLCEEEFT